MASDATRSDDSRSIPFIDPRIYPDPPCRVPTPPPANDPHELLDLERLCRDGRIYAVEEWIKAGKPIWARDYRIGRSRYVGNPLAIAVDTGQYDVTRLLLCNGAPPDGGSDLLLTTIVADRDRAMLDLLVAFGADLTAVSPLEVVATYDVDLYDCYEAAGGDLTRGHALARSLGQHSSNRPGYGWAKRHKDEPRIARELAVALIEAVKDGKERAVALLLWAGADPHRSATDINTRFDPDATDEDDDWTTAITMATLYGQGKILALLKPDPAKDDFTRLWKWAADFETIKCLAAIQPPERWDHTLVRCLERIARVRETFQAEDCLKYLTATYHARLEAIAPDDLRDLRRAFKDGNSSYHAGIVIKWLRRPEHCAPEVYATIVRAPALQARLQALGIPEQLPPRRGTKR